MTRLFLSSITLVVLLSTLIGLASCGAPPGGGPSNGGPAAANPASSPVRPMGPVNCSNSVPADIIAAIYSELEQSKTITREEWQFNISISAAGSRKTVLLTGWSQNRAHIITTVEATATGCSYDYNNFKATRGDLGANYKVTANCTTGYFACGDVCLPDGEICKLTGASTTIVPVANTAANSVSNSAPSNSNSNGTK